MQNQPPLDRTDQNQTLLVVKNRLEQAQRGPSLPWAGERSNRLAQRQTLVTPPASGRTAVSMASRRCATARSIRGCARFPEPRDLRAPRRDARSAEPAPASRAIQRKSQQRISHRGDLEPSLCLSLPQLNFTTAVSPTWMSDFAGAASRFSNRGRFRLFINTTNECFDPFHCSANSS